MPMCLRGWQERGLKIVRPVFNSLCTAQLVKAQYCLKGERLQVETAFIALRSRQDYREPEVCKAGLQLLSPFHLCRGTSRR